MAGIYLHIPFCSQFCTYCNFYSVKGEQYKAQFVKAIKGEIEKRYKDILIKEDSTIYMGGGTPSTLDISQIEEIFSSTKQLVNGKIIEATIEVNPDDITLDFARSLKQIGFNRVSMGIQTFSDAYLQWMNRRHTKDTAIKAYEQLRDAGFTNISLDLIFGYSQLTQQEWLDDIKAMIKLSPEHISAYQMSVEPGSKLSAMVKRGEYNLLPDTQSEIQYNTLQKELALSGYKQYEVSNFCKEGFEAKHNSSYWRRVPYIGLGPAAHSFKDKERCWNTASIKKYCVYYLSDNNSNEQEIIDVEHLTDTDIFNEKIMLSLRTVNGLKVNELDPVMYKSILPEINREISKGNLIMENDVIRVPKERLFISDLIIRELFA